MLGNGDELVAETLMTCTDAYDATRTPATLDAGELLHYHTLYSFGIWEKHVCRLAVVTSKSVSLAVYRHKAHRVRHRLCADNGVMVDSYLRFAALTDGLFDVSELLFLAVNAVGNAHLRYLLCREIQNATGHLEGIA